MEEHEIIIGARVTPEVKETVEAILIVAKMMGVDEADLIKYGQFDFGDYMQDDSDLAKIKRLLPT